MKALILLILFTFFLSSCEKGTEADNKDLVSKLEFTGQRCLDTGCTKTETYHLDSAKRGWTVGSRITYTPKFNTNMRIEFYVFNQNQDTLLSFRNKVTESYYDQIYYYCPVFRIVIQGNVFSKASIFENDSIIWTGCDSLVVYR